MLRALATLSVLAVVSFAFSTAVALMIVTHASPAEARPLNVVPAIDGQGGATCPGLRGETAPRCPALRGDRPSMADVVEAARRAECPAFSERVRPNPPTRSSTPPPATVLAAYHGTVVQPPTSS